MKVPKCELCNRKLVISKINKEENRACLSCPDFVAGNDEHTSYFVELTDELEKLFENDKMVLYW